VIELLALGNALNTTKIAKHLTIDDGALTLRLFGLAKEDLIRVCGADGSTARVANSFGSSAATFC